MIAAGLSSVLCAVTGFACPAEEAAPSQLSNLVIAEDGSIELPSGLVVRQQEIRFEPNGVPAAIAQTIRYRYVAAQLADTERFGFDRIEDDFSQLCSGFALDFRRKSAPKAEQVIISIASEELTFGETAPEVVQYFDSFRITEGNCIWEGL